MVDYSTKNSLFKNIIRQMVKVSRSAFGLNENVEILSNSITDQSKQASKVQDENSDTLAEVNRILETARRLEQTSNDADAVSKEGIEKQKGYLNEMKKLADSIEQGNLFINEFRKKSEEVNKMTKLIMDLSGRLDVLSINGAIEAARQGAAGAGFGVIAREMKNLAQETEVSAKQVEDIFNSFNTASANVQNLFKVSSESLKRSKEEAGSIYEVFNQIENHNENIKLEADSISRLVASLVERNENREKSTELILEGAERSTNQIGQVYKQSEDLHEVVENILENMGEIRLDWHDRALESVTDISRELSKRKINEFDDFLKGCFTRYPYIELLYVMNEKGIQINNNVVNPDFKDLIDSGGIGEDRGSRSYCRKILGGDSSYISGIYVSSAVNHLCLTVSVVFSFNDSEYILAADLNLEKFVMQS